MYYENSALWRFSSVNNLPTATDDPSLLGNDESALPPAARALLEEIRQQRVLPSDVHDAVMGFRAAYDHDQPLRTCACCGTRTYPFILDADNYAWFDFSDARVNTLAVPISQDDSSSAGRHA
jgi:hypothetical protein